jgi:hypothetical protein
MSELMVKFVRGISEEVARAAAESAGAKVRRRMRSDHDDEVMLLLKCDDIDAVKSELEGRDDVEMTEVNEGGYGVL